MASSNSSSSFFHTIGLAILHSADLNLFREWTQTQTRTQSNSKENSPHLTTDEFNHIDLEVKETLINLYQTLDKLFLENNQSQDPIHDNGK